MKALLVPILTISILALALAGCSTAAPETAAGATGPVVQVADFEIGTGTVGHEDGLLTGRSGPVGRVGNRLSGVSRDPAARAREVVDLMAESLVKELAKAGFRARRAPSGAASEGWLVRGAFVEVDEGNRLRRSMVGFGQGRTDVQVMATVQDVGRATPASLASIAAAAHSGSKPGAAPTLVLGPYGAAARFAMAGGDLDKNVRETARDIAAAVTRFIQAGGGGAPQ